MENGLQRHLTDMKFYIMLVLFFTSCQFSENTSSENETVKEATTRIENAQGATLEERFTAPNGFKRTPAEKGSFAAYLRASALFPKGKQVLLYNGDLKRNQEAQAAVIKLDVGTQDLQQCADAVMRLRAEYLFREKRFEDLHFNFTNGFNAQYSVWRTGKGISVRGNKVNWVPSSASNASYASFRKYMNKVFMFAGTASLEKELRKKDLKEIAVGDVLIQGGHPGHAVLVMDVARNEEGDKVFMLAQSYMPAQEVHILKNPNNESISPWYKLSEIDEVIETPEWTFDSKQLRTFE